MTTITRVSKDASQDNLTESDYRDIFAELRDGISLAKFCVLVSSSFSPATWNKWELGRLPLTRTMRQELRRGVSMVALPPTLAECVANVDPDAEVVRVGEEPVRFVILTGAVGRLSLRLNGSVTLAGDKAPEPLITSVIRAQGAKRDKPSPSTLRRAELRKRCRMAGYTLEDAAEETLKRIERLERKNHD